MSGVLLPDIILSRRWVWRENKKLQGRGEKEVQEALEVLNLPFWYEPWEYELKVDDSGIVRGVCFDFWLPETYDLPEMCIEVSCTKRPGQKMRKIRAVEDLYGIPTLLVNWPMARAASRRPQILFNELANLADYYYSLPSRSKLALVG